MSLDVYMLSFGARFPRYFAPVTFTIVVLIALLSVKLILKLSPSQDGRRTKAARSLGHRYELMSRAVRYNTSLFSSPDDAEPILDSLT